MNFLKTLFPFISTAATVLGGPIGGAAATSLGKALGLDKANPTPVELAAAYAGATPDQIIAAQNVEREFALKMQAAGFEHAEDLEKIAAEDRANARARQIAVKDRIPAILALTITVGFFGLLMMMWRSAPPAANKDLLNIMLGSLGAAWVGVTTYYFGSSSGSSEKTSMLAELAKK